MTVKCGIGSRDDCPYVRVRRRLACQVPGVQFGEGSVDVVEVERHGRDTSLTAVDLDDAKYLGVKRFGALVSSGIAGSAQGQPLATGRHDN